MKEQKFRNWLDIVAKLLPGIGAIIAGVLIPLVIHINAERSRSNQLYAEIVSQREMADTELRAKMFEILMNFFYGDPDKLSTGEKLTLLRLLALNFHEFFDLKPLFEGLESRLNAENKLKLRNIAKEIIGKQEAMLSHIREGAVFERILYRGEAKGIMVPPEDQKAYRGHRLGIVLEKIGKNNDYIYLRIIDLPEKNRDIAENVEIKFEANFYDMPFIDNTKLFNTTRFAVILKEILLNQNKEKAARIKIFFFPETYMSGRDRPYLDEMLQQLKKSREKI